MGEDPALRDGDLSKSPHTLGQRVLVPKKRRDVADRLEELVEFLVVSDGQQEVPGVDPFLLVVRCSVATQLEDFRAQIWKVNRTESGGAQTWSDERVRKRTFNNGSLVKGKPRLLSR